MPGPTRDERAKRAREFINKTVPSILASNRRARSGVAAATLIPDPSPIPLRDASDDESADSARIRIKLRVTDTLEAASILAASVPSKAPSQARVALLNMASPLRPGGGVLSGATSQEEWLCARTTLYPSLQEDFYRLPEVGGIYTPDVLVCRSWDAEASALLARDRFFVDVVTAAMLRHPDVDGKGSEAVYSEQKDRELVVQKMTAVMRILCSRGVQSVVLGAWGCGAYANPVGEIAKAWRRVLLGPSNPRKAARVERWGPMEIVFAIKDTPMAEAFAKAFGPDLIVDDS